jgi:hypothetical protein
VELYVLLYPLGGGMTLFYHDTTETRLAAEFLNLLPVTSLNYGGSTSFRSLFVSSFSFVMDPRDSTVSHIFLTELFFDLTMYILMALCWMESFGVAGST